MSSIKKTKRKVNPDLISDDFTEYETLKDDSFFKRGHGHWMGAMCQGRCKWCSSNKKWPTIEEVYEAKEWNEKTSDEDKIRRIVGLRKKAYDKLLTPLENNDMIAT